MTLLLAPRSFASPDRWVYDLRSGYLKEMATLTPASHMDDIYRFEYADPKTPEGEADE